MSEAMRLCHSDGGHARRRGGTLGCSRKVNKWLRNLP
jgi:hypothetical protein